MPEEEKKETTTNIDYSIKTMRDALEGKDFSNSKLEIKEEINPEIKKQKPKTKKVLQNSEKTEKGTEKSNLFLKEIQSVNAGYPKNSEKKAYLPDQKKQVEAIAKKKNDQTTNPINNPILKNNKEKNSPSPTMLFILVIVSFITIGSGGYYFYSNQKIKNQENPINKKENPKPIKLVEEADSTPQKLKESASLILTTENNLKQVVVGEKELPGSNVVAYYKLKENDLELDSKEILEKLNIDLRYPATENLTKAWLATYEQNGFLKMGLVFEIKNSPEEMLLLIKEQESQFPLLFKELFVEEDSSFDQSAKVIFKESSEVDGVYFFNFKEEDNTRSIDWGIVGNKYLIISTSKDFALQLTKDLGEEKDNKVENAQ